MCFDDFDDDFEEDIFDDAGEEDSRPPSPDEDSWDFEKAFIIGSMIVGNAYEESLDRRHERKERKKRKRPGYGDES